MHYCWKGDGSSQPCCASKEDMLEKMVAAYLNLFLFHACSSGSLPRWTHVGQMFSLLYAGYVCRDIFYRAVMGNLTTDQDAASKGAGLNPEAVGAGDTDFATEHAARVTRVKTWLGKPATRLHIGVLFMLVKILDTIM